MYYQGSCVAVYSPNSYPKILKVVKHLQAVNYSTKQLTVMGRRANVIRKKTRFLNLIKPSKYEKIEQYFWSNLKLILKGETCFKTSEASSIDVTGELSQRDLKNNLTENTYNSYAEIAKLLEIVGIPNVSFEYYKSVLKNGQLLLIIHGNYQELKRAGNLLDLTGNLNVSLHLTNSN